MLPEKYTALGFKIVNFGSQSRALIFNQKPVFVFAVYFDISTEFITSVCNAYLSRLENSQT